MSSPARIYAYGWAVRLLWALEMGDIHRAVGAGSKIAAAEMRHREEGFFDSDITYYHDVFSRHESPEVDGVVVTLDDITRLRSTTTPLRVMYSFAEYLAFTQDDRGVWTMSDVISRRKTLPKLDLVDLVVAVKDSERYRDLFVEYNQSANYGLCEFAELMYDLAKDQRFLPPGCLIHSYMIILESVMFRFGPQMVNSFKESMVRDCGVPDAPLSVADFLDESSEDEDDLDEEDESAQAHVYPGQSRLSEDERDEGLQPADLV